MQWWIKNNHSHAASFFLRNVSFEEFHIPKWTRWLTHVRMLPVFKSGTGWKCVSFLHRVLLLRFNKKCFFVVCSFVSSGTLHNQIRTCFAFFINSGLRKLLIWLLRNGTAGNDMLYESESFLLPHRTRCDPMRKTSVTAIISKLCGFSIRFRKSQNRGTSENHSAIIAKLMCQKQLADFFPVASQCVLSTTLLTLSCYKTFSYQITKDACFTLTGTKENNKMSFVQRKRWISLFLCCRVEENMYLFTHDLLIKHVSKLHTVVWGKTGRAFRIRLHQIRCAELSNLYPQHVDIPACCRIAQIVKVFVLSTLI